MVDVPGLVADQVAEGGADVGDADISAPDDEDVWLATGCRTWRPLLLRLGLLNRSAKANCRRPAKTCLPFSILRRLEYLPSSLFALLFASHSSPDDTAEADMTGRSVDRFGVARGRTIATAVDRRT